MAASVSKRRARPAAAATVRHSRPPVERMYRIHQALAAGTYPNASGLARELEVSTKSIHRDIEFMRDRLGLPVAFESVRNGFHYTEEVAAFPTVQLTEGELVALLVAERALHQYRGTPFERPLLTAIRKMASSMPETISVRLSDIEQAISFRTSVESRVDLDLLDRLAKATAAGAQLELNYRKPGSKAVERRIVDPCHLANINGDWFLFAYCHLRRDIRTFSPARMVEVKPTGKPGKRGLKFSLEKHLKNSFGVHAGAGLRRVVIRFSESVADYIREKKWHAAQELVELPGGGVELRMDLSSLVEVQRWVLGWAGHATVIEPAELAASVREAGARLAAGQPGQPTA